MASMRLSRPDSGLGFKAIGLKTLAGVPSSLGSGPSSNRGAIAGFELRARAPPSANAARVRQSRPDSGLGVQTTGLKPL
jgi:hypothetical protein